MIEATNLTRRYGRDFIAVDGLDLNVPSGAFYGFLGANGAGKSTTIRMLCGQIPPSAGTARVAGFDVAREPLEVKRHIGVMPEEPVLYERLTAAEFLEFAGRLHDLPADEARRRTNDLLDLLELANARDRLIADYSMGMRKKTALAAALIHRPRVLFLDEPFNGLDTLSVRTISRVLQRLTEGGTTVFFSSHVMETVERLCSRIAVLARGKLVAEGTIADLRAQAGVDSDMPLETIFLRLVDARAPTPLPTWL